jgi:hypothetical protein
MTLGTRGCHSTNWVTAPEVSFAIRRWKETTQFTEPLWQIVRVSTVRTITPWQNYRSS